MYIQGENKLMHKLSTVQFFVKISQKYYKTYVLRYLGKNIILTT
jgi:hypothetical protein